MRKNIFLDSFDSNRWPDPNLLAPLFLDLARRAAFFESCRDGGSFSVEGMYGTGNLTPKTGRVDAHLYLFMNPDYGAYILYPKWDGRMQKKTDFCSKGDLRLLPDFVRSLHDTPLSRGLFVPFEKGWIAVKGFLETEGEIPNGVEWIAASNLPRGTFPDP